MPLDAAFAQVRNVFPEVAHFRGTHFHYAERNGVVMIERKRTVVHEEGVCPTCGHAIGRKERRFFYWLLVDGAFQLVHSSPDSKLAPTRTIGSSFTPGASYAH